MLKDVLEEKHFGLLNSIIPPITSAMKAILVTYSSLSLLVFRGQSKIGQKNAWSDDLGAPLGSTFPTFESQTHRSTLQSSTSSAICEWIGTA